MNIKDHLSQETLDLFLAGELSDEIRRVAALHLSYCPICRDLKNDLTLNLAADQMWREYERSAACKTHINESIFHDFWLGRISDETMLNEISHHCIVCRDCREKREHARIKIREEQNVLVRTWVLLAALARQLRRPRVFLVVASVVMLLAIIKFWPARRTTEPRQAKNEQTNTPAPAPTPNVPNSNPSSPPPSPEQQAQKAPTPPQKQPPRVPDAREFVVQAQEIDLTRAADLAEVRELDSNAQKNLFTIVALRSASTPLRITLPANSKRGVYDVSVRDQAFLTELVSVKTKTADGAHLYALLDLRMLKQDNYILRVTRRDTETGHEYVGDYNIRILESKVSAP